MNQHITERLVKMVSEDIIKVVVDQKEVGNYEKDTGLFRCIFENKNILA